VAYFLSSNSQCIGYMYRPIYVHFAGCFCRWFRIFCFIAWFICSGFHILYILATSSTSIVALFVLSAFLSLFFIIVIIFCEKLLFYLLRTIYIIGLNKEIHKIACTNCSSATIVLICDALWRRDSWVRRLPGTRNWCCAADRRSVQWRSRRLAADRWPPHSQQPALLRRDRHIRAASVDRTLPPNSDS